MEENQYSITISEAALKQIRVQLEKHNTPHSKLRLGVKGAGCSGFTYVLQFEEAAPRDKDVVFNFEDISIIIDKKSLVHLNGSHLDWETSLLKHGFKISNPNEKSKCGCGHSFSV